MRLHHKGFRLSSPKSTPSSRGRTPKGRLRIKACLPLRTMSRIRADRRRPRHLEHLVPSSRSSTVRQTAISPGTRGCPRRSRRRS